MFYLPDQLSNFLAIGPNVRFIHPLLQTSYGVKVCIQIYSRSRKKTIYRQNISSYSSGPDTKRLESCSKLASVVLVFFVLILDTVAIPQ